MSLYRAWLHLYPRRFAPNRSRRGPRRDSPVAPQLHSLRVTPLARLRPHGHSGAGTGRRRQHHGVFPNRSRADPPLAVLRCGRLVKLSEDVQGITPWNCRRRGRGTFGFAAWKGAANPSSTYRIARFPMGHCSTIPRRIGSPAPLEIHYVWSRPFAVSSLAATRNSRSRMSGCFETSWKRRPRRVPFRCACLALSPLWHCWSRPLGSKACFRLRSRGAPARSACASRSGPAE